MAALRVVLHVGFLAWNVFGVYQNVAVTGSALGHGANTYGGRWKYLTFINQVLQTVFFGFCVSCDLVQLCLSNRNRFCIFLSRLKDCTFGVLAFPIGVFVATSFWSIYAYDRELVYPKELDSIIPQWLNHTMHTFILPLLLIELLACSHQYPSKKSGLATLMVFCFAYLSWILWVYYASGIWVYPILAKLDAVGMSVFFAISFLIMVPFYCLGEWLTQLRWGSGRPSKTKKKKKSKSK
ncbi:androgen-dependent TFPI-regulating protein-like isoform X2 [Mixophyes fleayi]|uniref:androgen-dependent TFPI-regulating protein-like isoform X2 n=1 Tax=Mixophyes fleayi TaxID=3061075 RepID=UPI003F4DA245